MNETEWRSFRELGGLLVEDGAIWYGGVKHVPERTCSFEEFDQDGYQVLDSVCGDGFCGACWGVIEVEDNHCKHCGAKVVDR